MVQRSYVVFALLLVLGAAQQASAARGRAGNRRKGKNRGRCRLPGCQRCSQSDPEKCDACRQGFAKTEDDKCAACGFGCRDCPVAGPNKCDVCKQGFTLDLEGEKTCQRCSEHCLKCDEAGPGGCNECGARRMLHARLELHGEVHECLSCEPGCRECTLEHGCAACDSFYYLAPGRDNEHPTCAFSWMRVLAVILIVLLPICGCTYAIATDGDEAPVHSTRRVPTEQRLRDEARVVHSTTGKDGLLGNSGAVNRRRPASDAAYHGTTAEYEPQPEPDSPRRQSSGGAYSGHLMPGYSGIEIVEDVPERSR